MQSEYVYADLVAERSNWRLIIRVQIRPTEPQRNPPKESVKISLPRCGEIFLQLEYYPDADSVAERKQLVVDYARADSTRRASKKSPSPT